MKSSIRNTAVLLAVFALCLGVVSLGVVTAQTTEKAAEKTEQKAEKTDDKACADHGQATEAELAASVPELADLHEVVYPLWHTAYPGKDYAMIKELIPQAHELTAKLDKAALPGILRDKQPAWDKGKLELQHSLQALDAAIKANNEEEMLKQTELFHANYEKLVRTIRPLTKELDAFHQELYKLYHYYGPQYDLPQIQTARGGDGAEGRGAQDIQAPEAACRQAEGLRRGRGRAGGSRARRSSRPPRRTTRKRFSPAVETVHSGYVKIEHMFD